MTCLKGKSFFASKKVLKGGKDSMKVNGKELSLNNQEFNVEQLLDRLNVNKDKVVVEVDGVIITKEDFFTTKLKESNIVEVISFVGGG